MNGYITARDVAEKWNMSVRHIQNLCAAGKVDGAVKFGNAWAIPPKCRKTPRWIWSLSSTIYNVVYYMTASLLD